MRVKYYVLPCILAVAAACNNQTVTKIGATISESLSSSKDDENDPKKNIYCISKSDCYDTLLTPKSYIVPPHALRSETFSDKNYAAVRRLIQDSSPDLESLQDAGYEIMGNVSHSYPLGDKFPYGDLTVEDMDTIFKNTSDEIKSRTYNAFKASFYLSNLNLLKDQPSRIQGQDYIIQMRPEIYLKRFEKVVLLKNPTTNSAYCYSKTEGTNLTSGVVLDKGMQILNSREVKVGQTQTRGTSRSKEESNDYSVNAGVSGEVSASFMGTGAKVGASLNVGVSTGTKDLTGVTDELARSTETGETVTKVSTINHQEKYEIQIVKDNTEYCLVKRTTHYKGFLVYKIRQVNLEGVDQFIRDLGKANYTSRSHGGFFVRQREVDGKHFAHFDPIPYSLEDKDPQKGLYMDITDKNVMDKALGIFYPKLDSVSISRYPRVEAETFLKNDKGEMLVKPVEINGLNPSISTAEKRAIDKKQIQELVD